MDLKKSVKQIFGKTADDYINENIFFLPDNSNFEEYLIKAGHKNEIVTAISNIEGKGFIADYINKNTNKSKGRKKTEKTCSACKQNIYQDIIRDYSGSEGATQAVLDIITKSKTKYASMIAEEICKKGIPKIITNFFKKVLNINDRMV